MRKIKLTDEQWFDEYKPHMDKENKGRVKEYCWNEHRYILDKIDPKYIWTLIGIGDNATIIMNGWCHTNRLGIYITKKAWTRNAETTVSWVAPNWSCDSCGETFKGVFAKAEGVIDCKYGHKFCSDCRKKSGLILLEDYAEYKEIPQAICPICIKREKKLAKKKEIEKKPTIHCWRIVMECSNGSKIGFSTDCVNDEVLESIDEAIKLQGYPLEWEE